MALNINSLTHQLRSTLRWKNNVSTWHLPKRHIYISPALQSNARKAGEYKVTIGRTKPLTYEQSMKPTDIAEKKGFNSFNTSQLEGTFLEKEAIGQDLPHKTFVEDMFIRKFMYGTWPEVISSEIIVKRHHNLVRIAAIINRKHAPARQIYFLIGYTEELLSYWLKCPVKIELQSIGSNDDLIYKYI
jgi:small subunit ribosomal protein S24